MGVPTRPVTRIESQAAWVSGGVPRLGAIAEPAADQVYLAAQGTGAWRLRRGEFSPIRVASATAAPLRFVDSTRPQGAVSKWMAVTGGSFVECGSVGVKIARIAEGAADVYAKAFRYRLWDVAPGHVILEEAGGRLGSWKGSPIRYDEGRLEWRNLLATPAESFDSAVVRLKELGS